MICQVRDLAIFLRTRGGSALENHRCHRYSACSSVGKHPKALKLGIPNKMHYAADCLEF
jgi:hypothetical protein